MKTKIILITTLLSASALAGPCRSIRSNNFQFQSPCGPPWDPIAQQGQWFQSLNGESSVCSWEYYDDTNSATIFGLVQNIQYQNSANSNSNIIAFDIQVTVVNNLPVEYQMGVASNSHAEVTIPPFTFYEEGTMKEARITAEFAIPDLSLTPNGIPPYWYDNGAGQYFIEALNEDELGWYCWDDPQQPAGPGNFQVPTWRLQPPDIPPGQSGTAMMSFTVTGGGIPITDYRHSVLRYSQWYNGDVLYNRNRSLKISHWLDTLLVDNGYDISTPPPPFWEEELEERYIYASDASVFFNSAWPDEQTVLQITPVVTNQSPDAIKIDWLVLDAINYKMQYCDNLTNGWTTILPGLGIPPAIPAPMQWIDDGTIITNLPVWQQPHRFYRLIEL